MAMLGDLRFWDDRLEARFEEELAFTRRGVVTSFSQFRGGLLVFVMLKALLEGCWWTTELLFAIGAASNLLPYFGVRCRSRRCFRVWQWAALLTDVLQASIGCYNHAHMAPSHEGIRPLASLVYLSFGSTALWIVMYTSMSYLPFWMELVKAATISMVLLAFNERLCRDSPGLRQAYSTIHLLMQVMLRQRLSPAAPWPDASADSLPLEAGSSGSSTATWLCTQYQMHVVLLGFVATTWRVHRTERRARLNLLARCAQTGSEGELADVAAAALAEEEYCGSAVSDMDFFLGFGIPAALGILMVFSLDF